VIVAVAANAVMSVTPKSEVLYAPELLQALDPAARFGALCSGRDRGAMRAKLMLAAAIVAPGATTAKAATPLYDGLGNVHFPITTAHPLAQRYFDQGMGFAYGFNHAAAIASFREGQRLDPQCAMCWWGEALAHGPNINAPMDAEANARAVAVLRQAQALQSSATPLEQAMIAALVRRYSLKPTADRAALDAAYADAMLAAARACPDHADLSLLAAEAAMDTRPWDYWQADRKTPHPRIGEAVALVERVMARHPNMAQATHLYIHLMENGPDPRRAEAAADRLAAPLAPRAGHLVHMPAHIYYRLGRWQDSMRVNLAAARADEAWIAESGDKGLVRYGYYPHNVHFIVTSAQMAGDMPTALREARKLSRILDPAISSQVAWVHAVNAAPFFTAAQFATPAQVLAMAAPDRRLPYATAMRHYARALARAQQRNRAGFNAEITKLRALRTGQDWKSMVDQGVPAPDLLELAETVAKARWAYNGGRYGQAISLYRRAIAIEEKVPYMEPPYWYYPVHQSLGAALYRAGQHEAAADAFGTALVKSPNKGWALFGLAAAERAAGRNDRAAASSAALRRAWSGAPRFLRIDRL
jgi:tetratricopeptide (TPR) repeat protein